MTVEDLRGRRKRLVKILGTGTMATALIALIVRILGNAPDLAGLQFTSDQVNSFYLDRFKVPPASIRVVHGVVSTGCGEIDASAGPVYCPRERRIYLDPRSQPQCWQVVIAHEIAHHVQLEMGQLEPTERSELQADCYAGQWAKHMGITCGRDLMLAAGGAGHGTGAQRLAAFDLCQY